MGEYAGHEPDVGRHEVLQRAGHRRELGRQCGRGVGGHVKELLVHGKHALEHLAAVAVRQGLADDVGGDADGEEGDEIGQGDDEEHEGIKVGLTRGLGALEAKDANEAREYERLGWVGRACTDIGKANNRVPLVEVGSLVKHGEDGRGKRDVGGSGIQVRSI